VAVSFNSHLQLRTLVETKLLQIWDYSVDGSCGFGLQLLHHCTTIKQLDPHAGRTIMLPPNSSKPDYQTVCCSNLTSAQQTDRGRVLSATRATRRQQVKYEVACSVELLPAH
jgi:hypothetical protein